MSISQTKHNKFYRITAFVLAALLGTIAAISPAAAAPGSFADLDRSALAMIIAFGTLLIAIVIEVWRSTLNRNSAIYRPINNK